MIGFAQRSIAERGLANVMLIQADARATGLETDSFDLAHERLVLITLTSPQAVVDEMVCVVRPVSKPGTFTLQPMFFQAWGRKPG